MTASLAGVQAKLQTLGLPGAGNLPGGERGVQIVVANGVAVEPLNVSDLRLVEHRAELLVRGIKAAMRLTLAKRAILALPESASRARMAAQEAIAQDGFAKFHVELRQVEDAYPLGEPSWLTNQLRGATPTSTATFDLATLLAFESAMRGVHPTHRHVAVVGAVPLPSVYWAPLGTSVNSLVKASGGTQGPSVLLAGGPLSGTLTSARQTLDWSFGCITVLPADHPLAIRARTPATVNLQRALGSCETCQRCTEACPSTAAGWDLAPHRLMRALPISQETLLPTRWLASALACTHCGMCTVNCPQKLDPAGLIAGMRPEAQRQGLQPIQGRRGDSSERIPTDRLALKVDLARFCHPTPWTVLEQEAQ